MRKPLGWGWIVPSARPGRGRGWRFIMRSISQSAIAHDSSYNTCFVMKGEAKAVRAALVKVVLETKALRTEAFKSGQRASVIHVLSSAKRRRIIAPALVYHARAPNSEDGSEVHIWVHPRVSEAVHKAFSRIKVDENVQYDFKASDAFARVDIIGAKAFEVIQRLVPSIDLYAEQHTQRGIRRFVSMDPRAAACEVKVDGSALENPSETAPTQAEYDASRIASRRAALERPWEETSAIGVKAYSAMLINRGPVAMDGYTLIVSASWNLPLWLGVCQTGAKPAGIAEWLWCARRFGRAAFPDDYLDTKAGSDARAELFDSVSKIKSKMPLGKVSSCLRALEARTKDVKVRRVLRVADEKLDLGTLPSETMVRVNLRCPWAGQPTLGSELYIPNDVQRDAWCSKKSETKSRRRNDTTVGKVSGEPIGYITSVSAPAASVGLASALIDANALKSLTENFSRGKGKVFIMISPPGKPAIPAEAVVIISTEEFDEPWW